MSSVGAAVSIGVNAARELPVLSALAQRAIPPVSKAFQVTKDLGLADKLRGVSQLGIG